VHNRVIERHTIRLRGDADDDLRLRATMPDDQSWKGLSDRIDRVA
jgi:hypothetical protein